MPAWKKNNPGCTAGGTCACNGECPTYLDEDFEYADGSDIGPNFDVIEGTWVIAGEALQTTSPSALVISSTEAPSPNIRILAQLSGAINRARLILNYVDEDNYYFAEFQPSSGCMTDEQEGGWITLFTRAGGVDTVVGQLFHCLGDTVVISACLQGSTFSAADADISVEVTVAPGTSGYYGIGTSSGWTAGNFSRVIVTGTGGNCPECTGDEPNGSLDPNQVPDPEETGNEVYGACEYTCEGGVAVASGDGCLGQPGGDGVASGECPPAPDGFCEEEEMDEESFWMACDEGSTPGNSCPESTVDPMPAAISVTITGSAGADGTYTLLQDVFDPCKYANSFSICGGTIEFDVTYSNTEINVGGSGTLLGSITGLTSPYSPYPRAVGISGSAGSCDYTGATLTVNGGAGGGGPPAAGGCRVWAPAWLSNGAGWARIDNTVFVCPSATCRTLSPPGTGFFGQLEFTQCTPIG